MNLKKSGQQKKSKTAFLKKQFAKQKTKSSSKAVKDCTSTSIKETGHQDELVGYSEGFNVGFAKGFEDSHTMIYQGKVK